MNFFPENTCLGKLALEEIYDEYDGPKLFCASNMLGQKFLVYWCEDLEEDGYGWLYLPISEKKLGKLRRTKITIRKAFTTAEQGIYHVRTKPSEIGDTAKFYHVADISRSYLPPEGVHIDADAIEIVNQKESNWVIELSLRKRTDSGFPNIRKVTQSFSAFTDLIESLMGDGTIFPMKAVPGSFKVNLGSETADLVLKAVQKLSILVSANEALDDRLKEMSLDPYKLKSLYEVLQTEALNLTITPKTFGILEQPIEIKADNISRVLQRLENSTQIIIASIEMPQANDLNIVMEVLKAVHEGRPLIHQEFAKLDSHRQVKYYSDAAWALGLLTPNGSLTAAGRFLLSRPSKEAKYQVLADRFESSSFGWGWMKWSNVNSMTELDANTAIDFVMATVPTLSESTAKRRAQTIKKWLLELTPYHRDYHSGDNENACGEEV